ncbi:putative tetratricopeptide-like helical domain superfamily [Helianthus anomalus]
MKDTVKSDRNQEKVVDPVVEDKTIKSVVSEDEGAYTDGDVRVKETYGGKTIGRMGRMKLNNKARFYDQRWRKGCYEREQQDYGKYNRNIMLYDDLESSENEGYENENIFDKSPSSEISSDVLFNDYLTEANGLLKQAREWLTNRGIEEDTGQMLYKSTKLLSKAVDMKPMILLAVGQLGNTYLLHGELKLKLSRKLRALLAESDSNVIGRLDDEVSNREKFVDYLVNVCEECEELLVKAGRKYRLALSIDGDDMRALYNWGLALSFRAQLIAYIGPSAFDADKVYLAAIDKFNAMMSRSNAHTPDGTDALLSFRHELCYANHV